jgi:ankyrin repeat protein
MQGKADLVKILLSHEIEIDQRDNAGRTPLGLASAYGHSEVVKLLLNQKTKPDINVRDHFGISPIERAIFGGHLETAKLLLEAGATMTKSELKRQMGSIDALLQGRTGVRASIKQKERIFKTIALLVSTLTQTLNEAEIFCEEELKLTPSLQKEILKSYPHSMK